MDRLKEALEALGLKCGGTLEQRADRLFSVKGVAPEEIDPKLKVCCGWFIIDWVPAVCERGGVPRVNRGGSTLSMRRWLSGVNMGVMYPV